jgi:tyrosyl-tRNA synthetase
MFKKVMEIPDHLILRYFELVTDEHPDRIEELKVQMENGRNPRDCKLELARIITDLYQSKEDTVKAEEYFRTVFQKGELPEDMQIIVVPVQCDTLLDLIPFLLEIGIVPSGSEFRRLVKQGGVQVNQVKVEDLDQKIQGKEAIIKIGKKKFLKILFDERS